MPPSPQLSPWSGTFAAAPWEETLQDGTTANMIFPVAQLFARLSAIVQLLPGDLIFTGTPSGLGAVRDPRGYLSPREVIVSHIEGTGGCG